MTLTLALLIAAQAQAWQGSIDSLVKLDQFSGVVLVARNGAPLFEHAYGMADRESKRPNDLETSFNLGRAWPDYPNPGVRNVTIRQILEHTSGIQGNVFAAPPGKTRHDVRTLADYFELFKNEPLQFAPGTREQYSNAGYIVLGLLIERLSGENYYDYVRRHILEPAGMTRTASWPVDSLPPNTAIGYTKGGERAAEGGEGAALTRNTELLPGGGSSAGGGYSTAHDLLRLLNALRAHKIDQAPEAGMVGIAGGASDP